MIFRVAPWLCTLSLAFAVGCSKGEAEPETEEEPAPETKTSNIDKDDMQCPRGTKLVKIQSKSPGRGCQTKGEIKHGPWIEFSPKDHWKGHYIMGKKDGVWEQYDYDGALMRTKTFDGGRMVQTSRVK